MGSKPITKRAGTDYGSAPLNQEVTVDAEGTAPARFPRMSPLKQTEITDLVNSGDWSPSDITVGGERNAVAIPETDPVTGMYRTPKVSYSNYYSKYDPTAIYPPEGESDDTSNDKPEQKSTSQILIETADTGSAPPPVSADVNIPVSDKVDAPKPEGVISGGDKKPTGDDIGRFIGPGESRERMRAVKYRTNQQQRLLRQESGEIKRSNIQDIRKREDISNKEKRKLIKAERQSHRDTMAGGRELKRDARRDELARQARTEKYSYDTMQSSGEAPIKYKSSPNKFTMKGFGSKYNK